MFESSWFFRFSNAIYTHKMPHTHDFRKFDYVFTGQPVVQILYFAISSAIEKNSQCGIEKSKSGLKMKTRDLEQQH